MTAPPGEPDFPAVDLPPGLDPAGAVAHLLAELVRWGALPAGAVATVAGRIRRREELGSTAIGRGLALPHAQAPGLVAVVGAVGRCEPPIDWPGALDGAPVAVICLALGPEGKFLGAALHRTLGRLTRWGGEAG